MINKTCEYVSSAWVKLLHSLILAIAYQVYATADPHLVGDDGLLEQRKNRIYAVATVELDTNSKLNGFRQLVNLQVGNTGGRLFYNHSIAKNSRLMGRIGLNYFAYRKAIRLDVDKGSFIIIDPDFVIGTIETSVRWQVFSNRALYVSSGLAYNWHPALNAKIQAENKLNFGGIELTPENVGIINIGFQWRQFMPYLGIGLGKSYPKHRVSIGGEFSVYYMGKPKVNLDYTGFLETTTIDEQIAVVENNLSNYRFLPTLNLTLTYRLTASLR